MTARESHQADGVLLDRIRCGDADALSDIIGRHWNSLFAYAEKIVRATDVAEEIVQETFVRLWVNRSRLRSGEALKGYLIRTARNLSLGEARHHAVRRKTESQVRAHLQRSRPSALDVLVDEQLLNATLQAIEKLPSRRREAFVLVRIEGLSICDVAERMGLSRQTVANHLSLALRDLEAALQDHLE